MLALYSQLALMLVCACSDSTTVEKLEECARKSIESREIIKNYHLLASIDIRERTNGKLEEYRYEFEAWKKGERYRLDRKVIEESENRKNNGTRWIYCRNCEQDGMKITTYMGPNSISPVMISRIDDNDPRHYHIDWRFLGLRKSELYNKDRRPDADLLEIRKLDNITISVTAAGVNDVRHFESKTPAGILKITFDGSAAFNPTYFYLDAKRGNDILATETNVVYQKIDGIPFPRSMHYSSMLNKSVVMSELKINVKSIELNGEIEDSVFTLAGLNLREGQPIRLPEIQDSSKQPTWKDGKIDKDFTWSKSATEGHRKLMEQKAENPVPDVAPGLFESRWPYFLVAGFFALAGFLTARKIRRG
ncbi:MAG: hypothetical protein KF873_15340 [Gemmataceae bacterium]|nr:hypothetical protein [Gemmataceae bacterium]